MKNTSDSKKGGMFAFSLKRIEITSLVVLLLVLGSVNATSALSSSSTASSTSDVMAIRSEIAALLDKVEQLKQQLKGLQQDGTATTTSMGEKPKRVCPLIARALLAGAQGDDVKDLQNFLVDEGYLDGKNVSAYFGPLTKSALQKWQAAQGIISAGDASSTGSGVVGPRTREFILKRCGGLNEGRMILPFGTSTRPNIDKKGPGMPEWSGCPILTMPALGSCDGKLRLEWKSETGSSKKCLAWKCHDDDDDEDDDSATTTDSN